MSEKVVWTSCANDLSPVDRGNLSYIYISVPPIETTEHGALEMIDEVLNENRKFFNSPFTIPLASQEEHEKPSSQDGSDIGDVHSPLSAGAIRLHGRPGVESYHHSVSHSASYNSHRGSLDGGDGRLLNTIRGDEGRPRRDSAYSADDQNFREFDFDPRDNRRSTLQNNAPAGKETTEDC